MPAMKRLVLTSTLIAVATIALAPSGASAKPGAHRDRCAPRAHEQVRARSSSAVVLLRRTRVLIGCSTATGRRRVIGTAYGYWTFFEQVHVRGTVVAYVRTEASKYLDSVSELYRDDAVHAGRGRQVAREPGVTDVAIGPGGIVAYLTGGAPGVVLRLDRSNGTRLEVDRALHLNDVRFTGDRLIWRHGTTTQSTDATPVDHCGGHSGTLALALTPHTAPESVTACLRATGGRRTLTTNKFHSVATSGPWIATDPDDTAIVTANLASGAGETILAPAVEFFAINVSGTVAWSTRTADPSISEVFVHDTTGTRLLDTVLGFLSFGFDGTILSYGPKRARLPR
jgi:hypothetical protein